MRDDPGKERRDWPIVVGGCYRSGTSVLRRALDAHSRIHCGPEILFFRDFYGEYRDDPLEHLRFTSTARSVLAEDELLEILGSAFVELHERAAAQVGKPRWADKAPENVLHADGWHRLLGEHWLLVHVVRNPLDTLASMLEHPFPLTLPPGSDERAALYRRYLEAGLSFEASRPDRYHRILYEELAATPEAVLRQLMEWAGESFEVIQLTFNEVPHQAGREDPKVAETRRVHRESVGRWRGLLEPQEAERIWRQTADVWSRVDPDSEWAVR